MLPFAKHFNPYVPTNSRNFCKTMQWILGDLDINKKLQYYINLIQISVAHLEGMDTCMARLTLHHINSLKSRDLPVKRLKALVLDK